MMLLLVRFVAIVSLPIVFDSLLAQYGTDLYDLHDMYGLHLGRRCVLLDMIMVLWGRV